MLGTQDSYSALLLASLQAFGPERGPMYAELPKCKSDTAIATRYECDFSFELTHLILL
jgi:hypothetical protein